jgi:ElaB/YqjD/DUF883 family membrane-anchored ribosome-binding protein
MTGATGTPPTTPTQGTTNDTKTVQGSTGSTAGATTDSSQSAVEKALDTSRPAPEKILETNPPATAASAPGMTSNTITVGSDTSLDRQDRGEQPEGLAETASRYGRDMGSRASDVYEQGRESVSRAAGQAWDTAQRTAGQVRRQSSRGLSSAQSVLADNPLVGVAVGAAVGVMVGYLIGQMTASTRTTGARRYDDRDEFGDRGGYPAGYGGSYSGSSHYPDGGPRTDIDRYADRVRYSDGI